MSANDKLAATFGPGRTTPTPTLETQIAKVLAAHSIGAFSGDSTACRCDRTWRKNIGHRAHVTEALTAALAPVIAEEQSAAWLRGTHDAFIVSCQDPDHNCEHCGDPDSLTNPYWSNDE